MAKKKVTKQDGDAESFPAVYVKFTYDEARAVRAVLTAHITLLGDAREAVDENMDEEV